MGGLGALAEGRRVGTVVEGVVRGAAAGVAFLFTGQGAQRVGMGWELHGAFPKFRDAFR